MKQREASNPDMDFRSWVPERVIPGTLYELLQAPIGEGGYGRIYKVRHMETGRVCALKALHRDLAQREDVLARLRQEVRTITAILPHPNLVDIYDAGYTSDGRFFYVMELLEGRSLRRAISKGEPLDVVEACHVIRQVLSALVKAHQNKIIHRDIKPDNIFLVGHANARADLVKLLDFGVAKVFGSNTVQTAPGSVVGTYHYFAPENIQGAPISVRTDIYALGVTFWEALTGEHPFPNDSQFATLSAIVHDGVPPLEALPRMAERIPPDVCELVKRATAPSPDKRFHSAAAFLDAVDDALDELGERPVASLSSPGVRRTSTPLVRGEAPDGEAPDNGPGSTDREVVTPWHQKATKDDGPRPKRKKRPLRSSLLRVHDVPTHTMLPGALATSVPQGEGTPPAPPKAAPPLLPLVIVSVAAGIAIATGVLLVYARRHPPAAHVAVEPSAAPSNAPVASIAPAVSTVAPVAPPTPPAEPVEVVPTATTLAAKPPAAVTPEPAATTPADEAPPPPPRKKRRGPSQAEIDQALRDKQMGIVDPFKPEPKRGGKK